jgi:hypothetical protein
MLVISIQLTCTGPSLFVFGIFSPMHLTLHWFASHLVTRGVLFSLELCEGSRLLTQGKFVQTGLVHQAKRLFT